MVIQADENGSQTTEVLKGDITLSKSKSPLVFISHDTRDAELAEQFSKLLSSVSAGVLKSFRSSDKKGNQGIEYGFEWYPEIMKKLDEATDVVCLLTQNSINRPWLLYEAGVAKGKLDTTLLGIAIGVPLSQANVGPFAQFQNCANDEDSLSKLVMQLVKRIPNSEPDIDVIKAQVNVFIARSNDFSTKTQETTAQDTCEDTHQDPAVAKLFEEIKLMYSELPVKIGRNLRPENRKISIGRLSPGMLDEFLYQTTKFNKSSGIIIILSLFRNDFPWIYEIGYEIFRTGRRKPSFDLKKQYYEFRELIEFTFEHPLMREIYHNSFDYRNIRENYRIIVRFLERYIIENDFEQQEIFEVSDGKPTL